MTMSENKSKVNIEREDWNNLFILDALRYDYFENIYENYLSGRWEKRESIASCTKDWLKKNFS